VAPSEASPRIGLRRQKPALEQRGVRPPRIWAVLIGLANPVTTETVMSEGVCSETVSESVTSLSS
jgi:hypothetical protein